MTIGEEGTPPSERASRSYDGMVTVGQDCQVFTCRVILRKVSVPNGGRVYVTLAPIKVISNDNEGNVLPKDRPESLGGPGYIFRSNCIDKMSILFHEILSPYLNTDKQIGVKCVLDVLDNLASFVSIHFGECELSSQ